MAIKKWEAYRGGPITGFVLTVFRFRREIPFLASGFFSDMVGSWGVELACFGGEGV